MAGKEGGPIQKQYLRAAADIAGASADSKRQEETPGGDMSLIYPKVDNRGANSSILAPDRRSPAAPEAAGAGVGLTAAEEHPGSKAPSPSCT